MPPFVTSGMLLLRHHLITDSWHVFLLFILIISILANDSVSDFHTGTTVTGPVSLIYSNFPGSNCFLKCHCVLEWEKNWGSDVAHSLTVQTWLLENQTAQGRRISTSFPVLLIRLCDAFPLTIYTVWQWPWCVCFCVCGGEVILKRDEKDKIKKDRGVVCIGEIYQGREKDSEVGHK